MQSSPGVPRGTTTPSASTTLTVRCGCTRPTVETRFAIGSSMLDWKLTGDVSVMPYAMVTSRMCMRSITCRITSTGHGDPAMMPVRRPRRAKRGNSGRFSTAMNMVGTP